MKQKTKMTPEEHQALGAQIRQARVAMAAALPKCNLYRWGSKTTLKIIRVIDRLDELRCTLDLQYKKDAPNASAEASPYYGHSDFERKEP